MSPLTLDPKSKFSAIQQGDNPFDMGSKKAKRARKSLSPKDSSSSDSESDSSLDSRRRKHQRKSQSQQSPLSKTVINKHFISFGVPAKGFAKNFITLTYSGDGKYNMYT